MNTMKKQEPGNINTPPPTKLPVPQSNYVYLQFWSHFNWELYVKILKAKFI